MEVAELMVVLLVLTTPLQMPIWALVLAIVIAAVSFVLYRKCLHELTFSDFSDSVCLLVNSSFSTDRAESGSSLLSAIPLLAW